MADVSYRPMPDAMVLKERWYLVQIARINAVSSTVSDDCEFTLYGPNSILSITVQYCTFVLNVFDYFENVIISLVTNCNLEAADVKNNNNNVLSCKQVKFFIEGSFVQIIICM